MVRNTPLLSALGALAFAILLAGCGYSERRSMESVASATQVEVRQDADTSAADKAAFLGKHLGPSGWTYHSGAGALPLPTDFKQACLALGAAWRAAAKVLPGDRNLAEALKGGDPSWRAAFAQIDAAYAHARSVAAQHGVRMPKRWMQE